MSDQPMPNIGRDLQRIHRVITRGLAVLQEKGPAFADSGFPLGQKAAAHSAAHAQPAPWAVPFLLYNLEMEDRAHFLSVMPAELTQQLVPVVWKDEWAAMKPFLLP